MAGPEHVRDGVAPDMRPRRRVRRRHAHNVNRGRPAGLSTLPGSTRCAPAVHARRYAALTIRLVLADSTDHTRSHAITAYIQHDELRPVAPDSTAAPHGHRQGPRPGQGTRAGWNRHPCRTQPQQARHTTPYSHLAQHGPHSRRPACATAHTVPRPAHHQRQMRGRHTHGTTIHHLDTSVHPNAHRTHPSSPGLAAHASPHARSRHTFHCPGGTHPTHTPHRPPSSVSSYRVTHQIIHTRPTAHQTLLAQTDPPSHTDPCPRAPRAVPGSMTVE